MVGVRILLIVSMWLNVVAATLNGIAFRRNVKLRKEWEALIGDRVSSASYERVLRLAKKMHTWIFLNTGDEQAAYDEIGLTDEDNVLLGYGGRIEIFSGGKDGDCE